MRGWSKWLERKDKQRKIWDDSDNYGMFLSSAPSDWETFRVTDALDDVS